MVFNLSKSKVDSRFVSSNFLTMNTKNEVETYLSSIICIQEHYVCDMTLINDLNFSIFTQKVKKNFSVSN